MNGLPLFMEKWEIMLNKLIEQPVKEEQLERAIEISSILEKLNNYPYFKNKTYLNIRNGYDFSRDEMRGACLRYIYGQFQDSILYACFSVEMGLIGRLDEILNNNEKSAIMKNKRPLTLNNLIDEAFNKKILSSNSKQNIYELLEIRNIHIHAVNLISPLIISYQKITKNIDQSIFDKDIFEEKIKLLDDFLPGFNSEILKKYDIDDILLAYKSVNNLPTFRWAANQKYLKLIEDEVENIMANMTTALLSGNSEMINDLFNSYILRKRSLNALNIAEKILCEIKILM